MKKHIPTEIVHVKSENEQEANKDFAIELTILLMNNETNGANYLDTLKTEKQREIFIKAYSCALLDFIEARSSGRLSPLHFEILPL